MTSLQERKIKQTGCDVRFDNLTRQLYATDASIYQIEPVGAAFPKNAQQASAVVRAAADPVLSLEIVMADGRIETIGTEHHTLGAERNKIDHLVRAKSAEMAERWPPGLLKRWPGYGIERFLRTPNDLTNILAGSEGTLAAIFSAEVKISPLPRDKGLGLLFFASVAEAMQATIELLDLKPAAIEHIDRPLFDGTKGQLQFQAARDLLELDTKACESILIVEFYEDVAEHLSVLQSKKIGLRTRLSAT